MTQMNTQKNIALITGGSRGLGRNMAEHLAKRGVDLIITYHSKKAEAETVVKAVQAEGQRAVALQLDITDESRFDTFVNEVRRALSETFSSDRFDYLVNNAGFGTHASFMETTETQLDSLYQAHVKGPFFLTQKLIGFMKNGGRVLNISSGLTRFSIPGFGAYACMKGALEVLTRYQAKELAGRKITVNTFAPGAIETDFGDGAVRDNPDVNQMIASTIALGRAGLPEDIGPAVAALLSDDCGWINGQRIEASGGQMI